MKCGYHPEREAVSTCVNCGRGVCEFCKSTIDTKTHCPRCVEKLLSNPQTLQLSANSVQVNKNGEQLIPNANCPYCNVILDTVPKRKKKCPSCGKDIHVRTDPFNKMKTYYLKRDDALLLDVIKDLNISEKAFNDAKNRAPNYLSLGDIIWGLVNQEKQAAARKNDWQTMSHITWRQARYLYEVEREYFNTQQTATKEELQGMLAHGVTHVEVIACTDDRTCKKCASLNGEIFTIKEALEKMPLPMKCDTNEGWCRCSYGGHIQ